MQQPEPQAAGAEPVANPSAEEHRRDVAKSRGVSLSAWFCPAGHVLGHVERVRGVRRLVLYRSADCPDDVIGVWTGRGEKVKCSACKQESIWDPSMDALNDLMELRARLRRKRKIDTLNKLC